MNFILKATSKEFQYNTTIIHVNIFAPKKQISKSLKPPSFISTFPKLTRTPSDFLHILLYDKMSKKKFKLFNHKYYI